MPELPRWRRTGRRDSKEIQSAAEVLHRHRELATEHGHQADWVVSRSFANQRAQQIDAPKVAQQAVTYAREHVFERSAVQDERAILQAALERSMGQASASQVREEFERRAQDRTSSARRACPEVCRPAVHHRRHGPHGARDRRAGCRKATSPWRSSRRSTSEGPGRAAQPSSAVERCPAQAAEQILASQEKIVGLDGVAGAGKTTTLAVIREGAEANGYQVEGFAPTSRAAQKLGEAGIETSTLQLHLAKGQQADTGEKRLYILDESSLASTKQMHDFVTRLHPNDRVLLVGDTRQHEAVEAGRPFAQLQDAGMRTAKLDEIVRQRDAALKQVVEQLAKGRWARPCKGWSGRAGCMRWRTRPSASRPSRRSMPASPRTRWSSHPTTAPAPRSTRRSGPSCRAQVWSAGKSTAPIVLVPRQDLTGADRTWAERYHFDDVLLYSRNSKETGLQKGEYARVKSVDAAANQITVVRADGSEVTYDPRRQQGVSLYRDQEKAFSVGDRIQFTAPANDLKIANRELGTIQSFTDDGRMTLKMDSGRSVSLDPREHPHLDHGYAVTSHSSQGQTADRVLIHIDTELGAKDLLNNRMAYVAVSRGAQDAQIFTSDRQQLPQVLSRDVSHQSAHVPEVSRSRSASRYG